MSLFMKTLDKYISEYLDYCQFRNRLDHKILKAYRIDLCQYTKFLSNPSEYFTRNIVDQYITELHKKYNPKTVKRKLPALKPFFIT